jgi:hypothetical protein
MKAFTITNSEKYVRQVLGEKVLSYMSLLSYGPSINHKLTTNKQTGGN